MRIICPSCDAQYEVDDAAIPPEGRDVQCSNCGNAWFQSPPVNADKLTAALYEAPAPAPERPQALTQAEDDDAEDGAEDAPLAAPAPPRRSLDDAVLSVLREEAEREVQARKAEAQGLEMQGDLGLPPPVNPAVGRAPDAEQPAPETVETTRPEIPGEEMSGAERRIAGLKGRAVPPPKTMARRDLLPDIEEINSSLKPRDKLMPGVGVAEDEAAGRSAFRSGFSLMILVAVLAAAVYVMAPRISQQIPGLAGAMTAYVAAVDAGRLALDGAIRSATGFVQGLTGGH